MIERKTLKLKKTTENLQTGWVNGLGGGSAASMLEERKRQENADLIPPMPMTEVLGKVIHLGEEKRKINRALAYNGADETLLEAMRVDLADIKAQLAVFGVK